MRRYVSLIMAIMLIALSVSACTKKEDIVATQAEEKIEETQAEPVETATEAPTEEIIGMPNPIVAVKDTGEYYDKLGIYLNATRIDDNPIMETVSGEIAQVSWIETNVNGEDVNFILRATKNSEIAESLPGVYDEKMTDVVRTEVPLTDTKTVTLNFTEAPTEGYGIYTWKDGQIHYSLTYDKDMSQMALAEILDSVMDATGIRYHNEHISPLTMEYNLDDAIWPIDFDKNAFKKKNGKYYIECDLYAEEYFDAVEVSLMQVGDTIKVSGDEVIEITSIERNVNGGDIKINGGIDEGGFTLAPGEGGTYRVRELDDMMTYSYRDRKTLEIDDDVILTDTADIENKCEKKIISGDEAVINHIKNSSYIYPTHFSTKARIEEGEIEEIFIVYVP